MAMGLDHIRLVLTIHDGHACKFVGPGNSADLFGMVKMTFSMANRDLQLGDKVTLSHLGEGSAQP